VAFQNNSNSAPSSIIAPKGGLAAGAAPTKCVLCTLISDGAAKSPVVMLGRVHMSWRAKIVSLSAVSTKVFALDTSLGGISFQKIIFGQDNA
jgi:hypothetical protein